MKAIDKSGLRKAAIHREVHKRLSLLRKWIEALKQEAER